MPPGNGHRAILGCDPVTQCLDATPRPELWRVRGAGQVFLTTLTSTKLGRGPALTATPYVPDLDHFRGSYGAKNVMPLHRDADGNESNVADGLLEALSTGLATEVSAEDLLAYVSRAGSSQPPTYQPPPPPTANPRVCSVTA